MKIKTLEFKTTEGYRVSIDPLSVSSVAETENFIEPKINTPVTAIFTYGYVHYIDADYEEVKKAIFGE